MLTAAEIASMDAIVTSEKLAIQSKWTAIQEAEARGVKKFISNGTPIGRLKDGPVEYDGRLFERMEINQPFVEPGLNVWLHSPDGVAHSGLELTTVHSRQDRSSFVD